MPILKCKMCGGDLIVKENSTVCECEYCGTKQTVPNVDDEKILKLYERANRLRMSCEFDKAATVYESIIAEKDTEAEAYWGLVLCKFGIEYVDDPASGDKIPTCHRSSFDSVMDDSDFEMVMENADSISKSVYREQAKQIEEIRKGIIEVSGKEQPYDIFICYKETDENGGRTIDSVIAQDVYDALIDKGYRVFFSRITLEDKLGTEYEPYIFAALNSAQVMLAFGTTYDYYNAVWVKNEWSRFIKLMAKDKSKYLIPCFKDIDAYDMPKEFAKLQSQDMGKVGAIQDLIRGIDKLTGRADRVQSNVQTGQITGALTIRGNISLEDGDFQTAYDFFERSLDTNPTDYQAYLGKILAKLRLKSLEELKNSNFLVDLDKMPDFKHAMQFCTGTDKGELQKIYDAIQKKVQIRYFTGVIKKYKNKLEKEAAEEAQRKAKLVAEEDRKKAELVAGEECKRIEEKVDAIATALMNANNNSPVDTLRSKITAKESAINSFNSKATELQNIAANLPALETEDSRLKTEFTNFENKMNALNQELSGLGIFAGKRKKEIAIDIENLRLLRKQKEDAINENAGKMKGYNSANINSKITENSNEIQKAKNELDELKKQLEAELNKPSDGLSYDEAMKLLRDKAIADVFAKKYPALDFKMRNDLKVGAIVTLGKYENQIIEWKILACEGEKYLLIADKALDFIRYNRDYVDITWEKCTLRQWLNNDFINAAFSSKEKSMIVLTDVIATKNPKFDTNLGNNTQDKVFVLSIDEVIKYFADDEARQCLPATSASKAYKKSCTWWLRSPGSSSDYATYVDGDGSINYGGDNVNNGNYADRPAMWINLES